MPFHRVAFDLLRGGMSENQEESPPTRNPTGDLPFLGV